MDCYATIDVGTNSVLLLVARRSGGGFVAVEEAAEITRLGKGVDRTRALDPRSMDDTVAVIARYADRARELGAQGLVVTATSAARDAANGAVFLSLVQQRAGVTVEILSGDEEARLSFRSAEADFGPGPLVVVDIGGGSTELMYGDGAGGVGFRTSHDVGAVRLTERLVRSDPPAPPELEAVRRAVRDSLSHDPPPPPGARVVGVAGTVTTLLCASRGIEPYDPAAVHGATLGRDEAAAVTARLTAMPLAARSTVPGLPPRRADVIVAGGLILEEVMDRLRAPEVTVSARGLRWGLLVDRFGTG